MQVPRGNPPVTEHDLLVMLIFVGIIAIGIGGAAKATNHPYIGCGFWIYAAFCIGVALLLMATG